MKYGQHIESKKKAEWREHYIDYKGLKDLIKAGVSQNPEQTSFSPRTTSLTVQRYNNNKNNAEEKFFAKLEQEVEKVNKFTQLLVEKLRADLQKLTPKAANAEKEKEATKNALLQEAHRIGDDFLQLEKFVNLNYMGFHKILKKHDKMLPHTPCRQVYIAHLHQQPWVQGNYSDLLVSLSGVYSKLRGDASGQKNDDAAQGFVRSTTKFWVRNEDVSTVKHHVLQQLPVFQHDTNNFAGDAQLINSVYFDNASSELYHGRLDKRPGAIALRIRWYGNAPPRMVFVERKTHRESWKGEESVKERFLLPEDKVVDFLDGKYTLEMALADTEAAAAKKGKAVSAAEREDFTRLFKECFNAVDSKQLVPMIRTQYMRTAFQIPFDSTVRVSLDTNLCMIKENPEDGPTCAATGRWYRDPELPMQRTEITRFPHAVLEVKLSLKEGQAAPPWVQELLDSGYLTEVHKFSKFIHGTATLFPDMVRAVPYWVDDESVRASMIASAPEPALPLPLAAAREDAPPDAPRSKSQKKPRGGGIGAGTRGGAGPGGGGGDGDDLTHPLLGDGPSLKLMPDPHEVKGFGGKAGGGGRGRTAKQGEPNFILKFLGLAPSTTLARTTPMRVEPKTFFANERTFLTWLSMAVTIASIAGALLGVTQSAPPDASSPAPKHARQLVELTAMLLLPIGMFMVIYAIYVFTWRANNIVLKKAVHVDDRIGPLCLCGLVVVSLASIMVLGCVDFYQAVYSQGTP